MNMQATMTHFAIILPDWNSLESVRRAHSDLEAAALVFFALLVVSEALAHLSDDKKTERRFDRIGIVFFAIAVLAEIAAYPYGQRNDALSAETIGSLSGKAGKALMESENAQRKANEASAVAGDALTKAGKAEDALGRVEDEANKLKNRFSDRTVTDDQAESIAANVRPYAGQEFTVVTYWDLREPIEIIQSNL
jgi:hypothetical protein